MTAVLPAHQAKPILKKIKSSVATLGEGLEVLDINLEDMEDLDDREDQVSATDPLELPPHTDRDDSVLGSDMSNIDSSFSGFTEASASGREKALQQQAITAHSSQKKTQQGAKSEKDAKSSKDNKKPKKSSSKQASKPRASDSQDEERVIPYEPQPSTSAPPATTGPIATQQFDMALLVSTIMQTLKPQLDIIQSIQPKLDKLESLQPQLNQLQSQMQAMGQSEESLMPSAHSLPPFDESNPWRSALRAPCQNEMLTIEGLGTRPISDFEVFPPNGVFPHVYVRLSQSASIREDKVPKETVLFPLNKAQGVLMQALKKNKCDNTKILPFKGGLTMFTTPKELPNPFATKVLEASHQAFTEDKTGPALKEEDLTSLLFPGDSEGWENVASTFSVGKLSPDCFSQQFNENLPRLPDGLINKEFEARTRLARTLHTFTIAELMMSSEPGNDMLKVLVKSMVTSLRNDMTEFMLIRKACRKHLFLTAEVRHESTRLINGPIWGVNLFSTDLVREAIDNAAKLNLSLRRRWGMQEKRKFTEGSGPQPKNKRFRKGSFRSPKPQQPQAQDQKGQQMTAASSSQSPAFNPVYESQSNSFRMAGFVHNRGGRGRAGRGRGRFYQFQNRGRGGQCRGAPRGGPSRGRGTRGNQTQ